MSLHDALAKAGLIRPRDHGRDSGARHFGGVHAWRFAPEMVAALDALFAGHGDAEVAA